MFIEQVGEFCVTEIFGSDEQNEDLTGLHQNSETYRFDFLSAYYQNTK